MSATISPVECIQHALRYAFTSACGGRVVVVMSESGVVDVCLAESDSELLRRLQLMYADSTLVPDKGVHRSWVRAIAQRLEAPGAPGSVPLPLDTHSISTARCA